MEFAAIVPAHDEASRLTAVLDALSSVVSIVEIVVVDDGSTDGTGAVARSHPLHVAGRLIVLRNDINQGKGEAMRAGVAATTAPYLLFLDADLIGLTAEHIRQLIAPVLNSHSAAIAVFREGRGVTTLSHRLFPDISGQRALRRNVFTSLPVSEGSGYAIEIALTSHCRKEGFSKTFVEWNGVSHAMKEEKFGPWRGLAYRLRMYGELFVGWVRAG